MHQLPSIHSTCCPDGVKQSTCRTDNFVKKNYTLGIRSVSTAPIAPSIFFRLCSNRPSAAVSIAANPYSVFAYPRIHGATRVRSWHPASWTPPQIGNVDVIVRFPLGTPFALPPVRTDADRCGNRERHHLGTHWWISSSPGRMTRGRHSQPH